MNISILTSDEKYNIFPMFASENIYKNDLILFNHQNHICYIKDFNKYLCRNNKHNKEVIFLSKMFKFIYIRRKFV